jgi:hypothetical protein
MATPKAKYWKAIGGDGQAEPGPWRNSQSDAPPAPPTEVFWLERHAGMGDAHYESRASMGALPTSKGPQDP